MPIEIREFVLREGVQAEDFEKFMIEEVFPVVRTVFGIRLGMHGVRHSLIKTEPRRYWWTVELGSSPLVDSPEIGEVETLEPSQGTDITPFPSDIGGAIGQLRRLATSTLRAPVPVLATTTENITTPSPAFLEASTGGSQGGWFGHG